MLETISHHFSTAWPSRSPDFIMCDIRLLSYLKDVLFSTLKAHLAELKGRIAQHILNVTLRSIAEHAVPRFQILAENVIRFPPSSIIFR